MVKFLQDLLASPATLMDDDAVMSLGQKLGLMIYGFAAGWFTSIWNANRQGANINVLGAQKS